MLQQLTPNSKLLLLLFHASVVDVAVTLAAAAAAAAATAVAMAVNPIRGAAGAASTNY